VAKPRALTRAQLQSRKDKAVRFLENVIGDPDRASEVEDESLEDYAERRKIQILNPHRRCTMAARKTIEDYKAELADAKEEISELEETVEELQSQIDSVADIVAPEEEEEEEDGENGEDED
jgi:peptidoglycan hydrolase CwlO-like protein